MFVLPFYNKRMYVCKIKLVIRTALHVHWKRYNSIIFSLKQSVHHWQSGHEHKQTARQNLTYSFPCCVGWAASYSGWLM